MLSWWVVRVSDIWAGYERVRTLNVVEIAYHCACVDVGAGAGRIAMYRSAITRFARAHHELRSSSFIFDFNSLRGAPMPPRSIFSAHTRPKGQGGATVDI